MIRENSRNSYAAAMATGYITGKVAIVWAISDKEVQKFKKKLSWKKRYEIANQLLFEKGLTSELSDLLERAENGEEL